MAVKQRPLAFSTIAVPAPPAGRLCKDPISPTLMLIGTQHLSTPNMVGMVTFETHDHEQ
jgi:hypothetical protein